MTRWKSIAGFTVEHRQGIAPNLYVFARLTSAEEKNPSAGLSSVVVYMPASLPIPSYYTLDPIVLITSEKEIRQDTRANGLKSP